MEDNKKLNNIFGISNNIITQNTEVQVLPIETSELDEDLEKIRNNLNNIITLSQIGLSDISEIAAASQDDKMYNAFARMIHSTIEANKCLLELHLKKQEVKPFKNDGVINNNYLTLTTTEFAQFMQQKEENEK